MSKFPILPILPPDQGPSLPRKTIAEKYGGLLYLGVVGLVALAGMITLFTLGVWSMRSVWSDIYSLSDPKRSELDRVNAAWRLARDPRVTDRQKWDLAMNRALPPLGRYLLAESLTAEATAADPRGYALAASRSEGWPPWLRMLVSRPLAYASASGRTVDRGALVDLSRHPDRFVAIWADFALAQDGHAPEAPDALARLRRSAQESPVPERELASELAHAMRLAQPKLSEALDAATLSLRDRDPSAREVWAGWAESNTGIIRIAAPELPAKRP